MAEPQQQSRGIGGTLKSKFGPLPVWGWLAIITVLAVGYYLYAKNKQGSQQQPTPATVGQPGVVVINQGDTNLPPGTKPPVPPEDHDKDKDDLGGGKGGGGGHDHDDHHRHRKRHKDKDKDDEAAVTPPAGTVPAGGPNLGMIPTGHQPAPAPVNVGAQFPVVTPAAGEGNLGPL